MNKKKKSSPEIAPQGMTEEDFRQLKKLADAKYCSLLKEPVAVEVNGVGVFTCKWTMEQIQALMRLHENNKHRAYLCYGLTAVSVLLSLAALVIAIVR